MPQPAPILLGGRGEFIIHWVWDHRASAHSDTTGRYGAVYHTLGVGP